MEKLLDLSIFGLLVLAILYFRRRFFSGSIRWWRRQRYIQNGYFRPRIVPRTSFKGLRFAIVTGIQIVDCPVTRYCGGFPDVPVIVKDEFDWIVQSAFRVMGAEIKYVPETMVQAAFDPYGDYELKGERIETDVWVIVALQSSKDPSSEVRPKESLIYKIINRETTVAAGVLNTDELKLTDTVINRYRAWTELLLKEFDGLLLIRQDQCRPGRPELQVLPGGKSKISA